MNVSSGKRYFWLKLKEDFFQSKRIKKLRNMAGGDTYLIIYLKLQLKAMKTDGVITFDHLENDIATELALDLDEAPDDVAATMLYLLHCGLAESSDNEAFFFPYAIENVGSENSSAQRVREYRERQKALHCNASETQVKRIGNGEIEKEIEREKERDIENDSSEPVPAPEPAVFQIVLNDKTYFDVTQSMIDSYQGLYPAVDVPQEIRKMVGWSESNPKKRKTRRGVKAFINSWLTREQDRGPRKSAGANMPRPSFSELAKGDKT